MFEIVFDDNKLITSHKSKYAASMSVALSLLCNSAKPGIISHNPAIQQ